MSRRFRTLRGSDGAPLSLLGIFVILALVVTVTLAVLMLRPVLFRSSPAAATTADPIKPAPEAPNFDQTIHAYIAQVDGRSLFFIPPRPTDKIDNGPIAKEYKGPALLGIINDTAWFADGDRVSTVAPSGKSVRLIRLDAPWSARVEWQGGEFDVELFKRVPLSSLRDTLGKTSPASTTPPAIAAPPTADAGPAKPGEAPPPGAKLANPSTSTAPAPPPPPEAENAEAEDPKAEPAPKTDPPRPGSTRRDGRRSDRAARARN